MGDARIEIHQGDITRLDVDAIVNAANDRLAPGGGVCGAIHRAAGRRLAEACARVGGCPTGGARITEGYDLAARYVIHAVGPVWRSGTEGEDELLAACYVGSLALAQRHGLRSIAFPAISTGIYGYPLERATGIAVDTVSGWLDKEDGLDGKDRLGRVIFAVFGPAAEQAYRDALAARA